MYDVNVNIGQFNDAYLPIMDGVSLTMQNYAYWINRKYAHCCVATPNFPDYDDVDGFPVYRYFSIPLFAHKPYRMGFPGMDHEFNATMDKIDFNLVHAHSPFSAGKFALALAKERNIPIVATMHTKYKDHFDESVGAIPFAVAEALKWVVEFYDECDHVWVPQEGVGTTLREYGYQGSYEVMENGIDLEVPDDLPAWRQRGADRFHLNDDQFMGLFVGQHIQEKNIDFLLESVLMLMQERPGFHMVLVGEGTAKNAMIKKVEQSGLAGRFRFHDVVHDRDVLKEIYARADLFLFPSLYDNAPLVVREAAAFQTPSLLLEGATAAEPILEGQNGFLSKNDIQEYTRRIREIMDDKRALAKAAIGASLTLCQSWESMLKTVIHRYREILASW